MSPLITEVAGGSDAALTELHRLIWKRLLIISSKTLFSIEDQKEIADDVLWWVWQNASKYDHRLGTVMGWISVVARRRSIDRLRQRPLAICIDVLSPALATRLELEDGRTPEIYWTEAEDFARVPEALAGLPPLRRRLITLAFVKGMTHTEIAVLTRLPLGSIKSHLRRGLTALRHAMDSNAQGTWVSSRYPL